ncbi:BBP7 family outer membrane beta-barrel protein [Planctomycetes bacterium K23_9]|uniref:Uncharacterized protein n=1 Tax=Stieleria marina TaxID=1930275 RepID=A0A517NWE1_9BACT|nr:hypothetical protein K239x_34530 [Planctomycetes bacterium K23_9]
MSVTIHSSHTLVNPVPNLKTSLCLAMTIATLVASQAPAQQNTRSTSVRNTEQAARASWTPTRGRSTAPVNSSDQRVVANTAANQQAAGLVPAPVRRVATNQRVVKTQTGVRQASHHSRTANHNGAVRQTSHAVRGRLPASAMPVGTVISHGPVMDAPLVDGGVYETDAYPLDGQISMAPVHGGGIACDCGAPSCGLEAACGVEAIGCGCGAGGCDGGCDSMGCGSGGCTTGCGGNCSMCGELTSDRAWRPAITLRLPQDGWASFEALHWYQDGMRLPALVTTSGENTARADAGVLGQSGTRTLFGGEDVLDHRFDGFRTRFGFWFDRCHTWGLGAEYFNIGQESETFSHTSSGTPILARPFFNTTTGLEDSELVAFPGIVSGNVTARASSELFGGGFHLRHLRCCQEGCKSWLFCGCKSHYCSRSETMIGYRYLQLDEDVSITENLVGINPTGNFAIRDSFDTRNQFNGVDLGWKYRVTRGYWTYDAMLRLAVGNTRQTVRIDGQTTITDPNNPPATTSEGGLLAQSSNIGLHKQDEFSVVPEFNANIGYQLTDHLRATFGYTFIYWSNVVRPGDHISTDLNTGLLPPAVTPLTGVSRPAFAFDTTDYWAQGLSYGFEYRW